MSSRGERQGPVIVGQGEVELAEGLVGQGPVVVALGRLGRQRDADPEGVDRPVEMPEPVVAQALVEVQPEVLRPELQAAPELLGGEVRLPGSQVGPPEVIVLPGRRAAPPDGLSIRRRVRSPRHRPDDRARATGSVPSRRSASVEDADGLLRLAASSSSAGAYRTRRSAQSRTRSRRSVRTAPFDLGLAQAVGPIAGASPAPPRSCGRGGSARRLLGGRRG